jgi:hypothetical protein
MSPDGRLQHLFSQSELATDMVDFFSAEANQPSPKLQQLPTFYAFLAQFHIMLVSVARALHFAATNDPDRGIFAGAVAEIPVAAGLARPVVDNRARPGLDRAVAALSFA